LNHFYKRKCCDEEIINKLLYQIIKL